MIEMSYTNIMNRIQVGDKIKATSIYFTDIVRHGEYYRINNIIIEDNLITICVEKNIYNFSILHFDYIELIRIKSIKNILL